MTHIAVIKLAPGQCGFYDNVSGTHLTLTNREAKIMPGTNTAGLVNAVKTGKITVVSGSLGSEAFVYKEATEAIPTYYRLLEKKVKQKLKNKSVKTVKARELVNEESKVELEIDIEETKKVEEVAPVETVMEEVVPETVAVEEKEEVVEEEVKAPKKKTTRK